MREREREHGREQRVQRRQQRVQEANRETNRETSGVAQPGQAAGRAGLPGRSGQALGRGAPTRRADRRARPARPLDAIDLAILRLLRADGRASVRSVAERVHISRANAYARIGRLLDEGVIKGFSARVDHERAGDGAAAYIAMTIVQDSWATVRDKLARLPGVSHIALVSGDFDVLMLVHTADNQALRELVLGRIQPIPEVLTTRTLLVFEEAEPLPHPEPTQ